MEPIALDPGRRGVVAVVRRGPQFLVIRRSRRVVAPLAYCFPGGGIEPGESEPEAVVREVHEELRMNIRPSHCVWRSVTPWQVDLAWWLCDTADSSFADGPASIDPNPDEVQSVHWLTREQMSALPDLLESNRAFLTALSRGEIDLKSSTDAGERG